MTTLVYLTGPPAVGKSTLMAAVTAGCGRAPRTFPFAYDVLLDDATPVGVELGRRRPEFPGTDALSMSVSPAACRWLATRPSALVLGEGARLATRAFLDAGAAAGYTVTVIYLIAPGRALDERCRARGSRQDDTWRRGQATRAARIAEHAVTRGWPLVTVDTTLATPTALARWLHDRIPVLHVLPEGVPV